MQKAGCLTWLPLWLTNPGEVFILSSPLVETCQDTKKFELVHVNWGLWKRQEINPDMNSCGVREKYFPG